MIDRQDDELVQIRYLDKVVWYGRAADAEKVTHEQIVAAYERLYGGCHWWRRLALRWGGLSRAERSGIAGITRCFWLIFLVAATWNTHSLLLAAAFGLMTVELMVRP